MTRYITRDQSEDEASDARSKGFQEGFDLAQEKALEIVNYFSEKERSELFPILHEIHRQISSLSPLTS